MQIERTPSTWETLTAVSQRLGLILPSRHFRSSPSHRAQSRHSISSIPQVVIRSTAIFLLFLSGPLRSFAQTGVAVPPKNKPTLTYFEKHFIVRDGAESESAPLKLPPEEAKLSTLFRRNATFAVWDERGLTVRVGPKVKSFKLQDVATSPKAFTRDEIVDTLVAIRKGDRTKAASALSGAVRIGNHAYFLARWEDRSGKPWAEAIVQVDLSQRSPEPRFVARADALSLAAKPIDDQLFILDGKVSYIAKKESRWGLELLDSRNGRLDFEPLGDEILSFAFLDQERESGLFIERTSYGTNLAGRVSLKARTRKTLFETRDKIRFIDDAEPACLVIGNGKSSKIVDTASGAIMDLPASCGIRRMTRGLIIWTPSDEPKKAWLYDPTRWEGRAWWNSELSKPEG